MPKDNLVLRWNVTAKDRTAGAVKSSNRSLAAIGNSARQSNIALGALAVRLGVVAAAYTALAKSVQAVNTVQNLNNRLNLVANKNLEETKEKLFDVARASFASFDSTSQFYAKLALSAKELGRSQEDLLKVVEITNKAVAISGSSAESAAGGLIQFSQGIASNRLAGDELRSVLENLPGLADTIARGLGVTRGELRELAEQGKLTAQAVVDAVLSQEQQVNEYFSRFDATVSLAAQQFGNSFIRAVDKIEKNTGAFKVLGAELLDAADALTALTDDAVDFVNEAGGVEEIIKDLRVEMETLQVATVAYIAYIGGGAVASAGAAFIKILQGIAVNGLAAKGALGVPFVALIAGYYASSEAITAMSDALADDAERANVASRNLAVLEGQAARLQATIDGAGDEGVFPKISVENLQNLRAELARVNDEIRAQKSLIAADVGPAAPADVSAPTATAETAPATADNDAIIIATEERNRKLAALRKENLDGELRTMALQGEIGLIELQKRIAADQSAFEADYNRRLEQSAIITDIEQSQRDMRLSLIQDSRERELAFELADYADRVERIQQEITDAVERDRLLEEQLRIHRENMGAINAEYDEQDAERRANQQSDGEAFWNALTGQSGAFYGKEAEFRKGEEGHIKESEKFKSDVLKAGLTGLAKHSKAAFNIAKAAGIAQAIVDTYKGVNRALGEYPPPTSFILAAAVAAAGFANVASIASQKFGGGGGRTARTGGSGGGSARSPATTTSQTPVAEQQQSQQSIVVNIEEGLYNGEQVANIVAQILKAAGDNLDVQASVR